MLNASPLNKLILALSIAFSSSALMAAGDGDDHGDHASYGEHAEHHAEKAHDAHDEHDGEKGHEAHEDHEGHEHEEHGAHVHGIAALNLVLDGGELYLELDSPAVNLLGFEHAATTAEDKAKLEQVHDTLTKGEQLFAMDSAAGCSQKKADVTSALAEGSEGGHGDMEVAYVFACDAPQKLDGIGVDLFDAFPAIEKLDVQFVAGGKQGAAHLSAGKRRLSF